MKKSRAANGTQNWTWTRTRISSFFPSDCFGYLLSL